MSKRMLTRCSPCSDRDGESIIDSPPPPAFTSLYCRDTGRFAARPTPKRTPKPATSTAAAVPSSTATRRPGSRNFSFIGGQPVESLPSGKVRTFGGSDGSDGQAFASMRDYIASRDDELTAAIAKPKLSE